MEKTANWFVLYVRSGSEQGVLKSLNKILDSKVYESFAPTKEMPYREKGVSKKKEAVCFPGYVFIKTNENVDMFLRNAKRSAETVSGAYYFLCYGNDKADISMRTDERWRIERLLNAEFRMEASKYEKGDKIRIVEGPLFGLESMIKRVDRHKRTAVIELPMMGSVREFTLMIEVIEKV